MKKIIEILIAVPIAFAVALLLAFPTMWLWNWLIPNIFGLIEINVWQALGINILCNILFNRSNS